MAECYRKNKELNHSHFPPLTPCSKCREYICHECIGTHLESGQVVCIECSRPFASRQYNRIREGLSAENYERLKTVFRSLAAVIFWVFGTLASSIYRFTYFLTRPLRQGSSNMHRRENRYSIHLDVASFGEKARFAMFFAGVVVVVAALGLFYAAIAGTPSARVLLALAGACTFWGILAMYLQYVFEPGLPHPVSQIVAYTVAFFIAILFGRWLISLDIFDRVFNALGW